MNSVILNILTNAIKFTPQSGAIQIEVCNRGENKTQITISDSGVGIPNELLQKLFDSSEITTRKGTAGEVGTGFGLPIARAVLVRMGGAINVNSFEAKVGESNSGTSFTILLNSA